MSFLFFCCRAAQAIQARWFKAISAENILLRQQLITLKRRYKRSPKLTFSDRLIYGLLATLINPNRLQKIAVLIRPSTLLKFHKALVDRKYKLLFSNKPPVQVRSAINV